MRFRTLTAAAGVAALSLTGTAFTGTASAAAYPVKTPALTESALYTLGPLAETDCAEEPIKNNDRASAQRYLTAMKQCLDATWEATTATSTEVKFSAPKLAFATKLPRKFCGYTVDKYNSQSFYCDKTRTITYMLGKAYLAEADDMWLMQNLSFHYGEHVQYLTGIEKAWYKLRYKGEKELREQNRRLNLQNDCLSGAFIKSIWPSLRRDNRDWNELLGIINANGDTWGGKGGSRAAWTKSGFATGDPASCNTWTAPSSKVA